MRQGPIYAMPTFTDNWGKLCLMVPLELVEDFENCAYVNWRDDKQGCFTLIVVKLLAEACEAGHKDRLIVPNP